MLKNLLNKLKWDEIMAVAAFAEAGDFGTMELAIKKEKRGHRRRTVKHRGTSVRSLLIHEN